MLGPNFQQILLEVTAQTNLSISEEFQWLTPEKAYSRILGTIEVQSYLDKCSVEALYAAHREIHKLATTQWGLYPLGFEIIDWAKTIDYQSFAPTLKLDAHFKLWELTPEPIFHQRWALTTPTLESITKTSLSSPGSPAINRYVLSIAHPRIDVPRYNATLTIASVKSLNTSFPQAKNANPLYDARTGLSTNSPTLFTSIGEPVWSTKTTSLEGYAESLEYATHLMKDAANLDLLAALIN